MLMILSKTLVRNKVMENYPADSFEGAKCSWIYDAYSAEYADQIDNGHDRYLTTIPLYQIAFINYFTFNNETGISVGGRPLNGSNSQITDSRLFTRIYYDKNDGHIVATQSDFLFKENGIDEGYAIPELYLDEDLKPNSDVSYFDFEIAMPVNPTQQNTGRALIVPFLARHQADPSLKICYLSATHVPSGTNDGPDRLEIALVQGTTRIDELDEYIFAERTAMDAKTYLELASWSDKGPASFGVPDISSQLVGYVSL